MKSNKKGFTIVELVIVIAIIAILAAVIIPLFANVVNKANQSSDIQTVRNMNTALALAEAENRIPANDAEAYAIVGEAGYRTNWQPSDKTLGFAYDKTNNKFVLYNLSDNKIIFPNELKGISVVDVNEGENGQFYQAVFANEMNQIVDALGNNKIHTVILTQDINYSDNYAFPIDGVGKLIDLNGHNFTINAPYGAQFELNGVPSATWSASYINNFDSDITFTDTSTDGSGALIGDYDAMIEGIGTYGHTVINGGTYIGTNGVYCYKHTNDYYGRVEIYDGKFISRSAYCEFAYNNAGETRIYGGEFTPAGEGYYAIGNCGDLYIENDLTIKGLWWSKDNGGYETSLHIANGKTFTVEDYLGFGDKPSNTNNLVYDGTGTFIYTCNGLSYEISSISDITGNVEFEPSGDNGFTVNGTLITDQASYSVNGITLTKLN